MDNAIMDNAVNISLIPFALFLLWVWWDSRRNCIKAKKWYEDDLELYKNIKESLDEMRKIKNG